MKTQRTHINTHERFAYAGVRLRSMRYAELRLSRRSRCETNWRFSLGVRHTPAPQAKRVQQSAEWHAHVDILPERSQPAIRQVVTERSRF